jgi:hypothetical protein
LADLFGDFADFCDFAEDLDFTFDFMWLRLVFFPELRGVGREALSRRLKVPIGICR